MPSNKSPNIIKQRNYIYNFDSTHFYLIDTFFKKVFYWNKCLKILKCINKSEMELKNWDKASKESIALAVYNGAVYELRFK